MRNVLGIFFWLSMCHAVTAAFPAPVDLAYYDQQVKPLLEQHCYKCHGPGKAKGGLTLASREALIKGGDSGAAIALKDPAASLLLQAINFNGFEMPPAGKLATEEIAILTRWVEAGAPMPAGEAAPVVTHAGVPQVNDENRNHWSFRPLTRPAVPAIQNKAWVSNPIDAFILARLEEKGLSPSPQAPPQQLIRRLHYDLVGLPPSLPLVTRFEQDPSLTNYQQAARELLESPHHGEHYARYWLDLVRYGESNSFERDDPKPFVWRYRDYVINFFNSSRGYNDFIREQLAGDEYLARRRAGGLPDQLTATSDADLLIATGYYRLGMWDDEPADPQLAFYDGLDDLVGTTGQAFLGLTLNCARCHDHKLDPLPQADYYRFAAFFRNIQHYGKRSSESVEQASLRSYASPEVMAREAQQRQDWESRQRQLRQQLDEIESRVRPHLVGGEKDDFKHDSQRLRVIQAHAGEEWLPKEVAEQYAQLRTSWNDLWRKPPRSGEQALCITEHGANAPATHILVRGNAHAPGDLVEPAFPEILSGPVPQPVEIPGKTSSGRRTALAEWVASPDNPLTARVMVNRVWQWHFGRGLVESANDFGLKGTHPTHPELLDWLAAEFIEHGWNLRHIHNLILTSSTYRQSSAPQAKGLEVDPQNRLFWRFDMRRLRSEELRDSILAMSDGLNLETMFGPSIYPTIEKEVLAGQSQPGRGWEKSSPDDLRRRSIYIHIKRSLTVPLMANFDVAEADVTCPVRFATTQPTQALTLLNSAFLQEQAKLLAENLKKKAGEDATRQTTLALEKVLQRRPTEAEVARGLDLQTRLREDHQLSQEAALKYFCLAMLNLNEFIYLD